MKAMILAAGYGKRLRPITDSTPKPMVKIDDRPLIEHQLSWLQAANITDLVINLHHLGDQIRDHLGNGQQYGMNVEYSTEVTLLETGGGIAKALNQLGPEPFLVLNGDIFTDFNFADLPTQPPADADMHLLLTPTPDFRAQGDYEFDHGRITRRGPSYVYCGVGVYRGELFSGWPDPHFSNQQVMFRAIEQGRASAQIWTGYWNDIGTPAQLDEARDFASQRR